jgi:hypothetical protein
MNGVTLKAVDPTAEDHLVRSPEIAAVVAASSVVADGVLAWFTRARRTGLTIDCGFRPH